MARLETPAPGSWKRKQNGPSQKGLAPSPFFQNLPAKTRSHPRGTMTGPEDNPVDHDPADFIGQEEPGKEETGPKLSRRQILALQSSRPTQT